MSHTDDVIHQWGPLAALAKGAAGSVGGEEAAEREKAVGGCMEQPG